MTETQRAAMMAAIDALIEATPVKAKDPQMQADAIVALRAALAEPVSAPHVGATQAVWDAINVDLQQILDDMSCWEGRTTERFCDRLEAAIRSLNAAVGHEREGYESAIAAGYAVDRLREENDALKAELAAPQPPSRVPLLTDEQIATALPWVGFDDLIESYSARQLHAALRAIEQAVRQKAGIELQ